MPAQKYTQIYLDLKEKIEDETYPAQEYLPSEYTLIEHYGCSRNTVRRAIKQLADDGMTMIIVTHEIGFARSVADRILFMDGGNVVVQTGTKDFFEKNDNKRVREFLGSLSERIGLNEHDTQNQKNDSASHSNSASHGKRGRVRKKGGRK